MLAGIACAWSSLPLELLELPDIARRAYERGGEREVQFHYRDRVPLLPIWHEGRLRLASWGIRRRQSRVLPATGWTWRSSVEEGAWSNVGAEPVDVPATMAVENGVWFPIRQGIRALLVRDERGVERAFLIGEPASHYYRVMTRSDWMPVLIAERI